MSIVRRLNEWLPRKSRAFNRQRDQRAREWHKDRSWIQRIPRGGFSSHSHENPIARLYASLALGNGVNAVKSGFGPATVLFALAPTIRLYVRTFGRMCPANRAAAARNDDLSCEMRINDRSSWLTRFPSTNCIHFFFVTRIARLSSRSPLPLLSRPFPFLSRILKYLTIIGILSQIMNFYRSTNSTIRNCFCNHTHI